MAKLGDYYKVADEIQQDKVDKALRKLANEIRNNKKPANTPLIKKKAQI